MARNRIGKNLVITSFGESHGEMVGVVIDGYPSNKTVDLAALQAHMDRRKPGQSHISTDRQESDNAQIVSGIFEGKTTGAPIAILIQNEDARSRDYDHLKDVYRPGHADLLYQTKYQHRDHRGGGRSSARVTAGWVAAGGLAQQYLTKEGISLVAWVQQIHDVTAPTCPTIPTLETIENSLVRCWHSDSSKKMIEAIEMAKSEGDSLGGIIRCIIQGVNQGLGEPLFGKLQSVIGQYILNINAVKGISFGDGFEAASLKGSEHNDAWTKTSGKIGTGTNHSGGIIGGMATGENILFDVAFKPTSTIRKEQNTINSSGESVILSAEGRHDPCVLPRAVSIVESMAALAIMDLFLER